MESLGRSLLILGLALAAAGLLLLLGGRFQIPLGKLPGDLVYKGKNTTVYFPLVTCLLLSAVLSLVLWAVGRK